MLPSLILAVLAFTLGTPTVDSAPDRPIVIRHDRPDSLYLDLGARFGAAVGHLEERVESTLVDGRWVLTAAHAIEASGPFDAPYVLFGGVRYRVEKIVLHPEWEGGFPDLQDSHDLALLKLDRVVAGVEPVPLYRDRDELDRVMTFVGRGKTGVGATGAVGEKGTVLRGATTRVAGASETVLMTVFNAPGDPGATELEGGAAAGDSGGPGFIEKDRTVYLAGVSSFGTGTSDYPRYGTVDGYIRVSTFVQWIESVIHNDASSTVEWSRPVRFNGWPETPAGNLAREFFGTLETGSEQALAGFFEKWGDTLEQAASRASLIARAVVEPLGGLDVFGWSLAGEHYIRVLVHSRKADAWRSLGLRAEVAEPLELAHLYMKVESAPKPEVWK